MDEAVKLIAAAHRGRRQERQEKEARGQGKKTGGKGEDLRREWKIREGQACQGSGEEAGAKKPKAAARKTATKAASKAT